MKLNAIFTRTAIVAGPEEPLSAVARRMQEKKSCSIVIVDRQRPVGIITARDLALALGVQGFRPEVPVRQVMSRQVLAVPEDMPISTAAQLMRERQVRQLPIVDENDHLVGMVTLDDLFHYLGWDLYNLASSEREMQVK